MSPRSSGSDASSYEASRRMSALGMEIGAQVGPFPRFQGSSRRHGRAMASPGHGSAPRRPPKTTDGLRGHGGRPPGARRRAAVEETGGVRAFRRFRTVSRPSGQAAERRPGATPDEPPAAPANESRVWNLGVSPHVEGTRGGPSISAPRGSGEGRDPLAACAIGRPVRGRASAAAVVRPARHEARSRHRPLRPQAVRVGLTATPRDGG